MKYKLLFLIVLLTAFATAEAAKKPKQQKLSVIMKTAKTALKNDNNQDGALNGLAGALGRPELSNKQRKEVYYVMAQLDESINAVENRKAYLKQPYDTAKFFNKLRDMYDRLRLCDSIDRQPDNNGRVRPTMVKKTHALRRKHRRNILSGAHFYLAKKNYQQAFPFYDLYCTYNCEEKTDTLFPLASRQAALTAFMIEDYKGMLRHVDAAIGYADVQSAPVLIEYKARSYQMLQNDSAFMATLKQGVKAYPNHDYFFVHLADRYHEERMLKEEMELAGELIAKTGGKALHFYAMSKSLLANNDYEGCIAYSDSTIWRDKNFSDAYYNKGISYINMAIIAQENSCKDVMNPKYEADKKQVRKYYQLARPCMETVRTLEPENKERWASPLYRIYLNLNLGDEFNEIDQLLNK